MPKCRVEILTPAWRDIDRISDYHLMAVGPQSAEQITDKLLDTIDLLADHPYMGPLHPDPVLARNEYRKAICGSYVCVYLPRGRWQKQLCAAIHMNQKIRAV